MRQIPFRALHGVAIVLALCAPLAPAISDAALRAERVDDTRGSSIRIEPTRTRVSLASVHLHMGDLRLDGHDLVGEFEINVPLMPVNDDRGTVRIQAPESLPEMVRHGAVLEGTARSESGQVNPVRCTIAPGGALEISIKTPRRTLSFATRYQLMIAGG